MLLSSMMSTFAFVLAFRCALPGLTHCNGRAVAITQIYPVHLVKISSNQIQIAVSVQIAQRRELGNIRRRGDIVTRSERAIANAQIYPVHLSLIAGNQVQITITIQIP